MLALIALVGPGCDSTFESDPTEAEITFAANSSAVLCRETDIGATVHDANGLDVVQLMVDDVVVLESPSDEVEHALSRKFKFSSPGSHWLKVAAIDRNGDRTLDSVMVDVESDARFDYWPMEIGTTRSFNFDKQSLGSKGGYRMVGTMDWTVMSSEPSHEGFSYAVNFAFSGTWISEHEPTFSFDSTGTFTVIESRSGVRLGKSLHQLTIDIPRYDCSGEPELVRHWDYWDDKGSTGLPDRVEWTQHLGEGPTFMNRDFATKSYWDRWILVAIEP